MEYRVVITERSLHRLEDTLAFYINDLKIPKEKVIEIKNTLLLKAKQLALNPFKGQLDPYLKKLNKGHRRLIAGNFKIIYRLDKEIIYITDFFDSRKSPSSMSG